MPWFQSMRNLRSADGAWESKGHKSQLPSQRPAAHMTLAASSALCAVRDDHLAGENESQATGSLRNHWNSQWLGLRPIPVHMFVTSAWQRCTS